MRSGGVLPGEGPKTSAGWQSLQQSHTSPPGVKTEQRSFAPSRDLGLCPRRVSPGSPGTDPAPPGDAAGSRAGTGLAPGGCTSVAEVNVTEPAAFLPSAVFFKDNLLDKNTFFSLKGRKKKRKGANNFSPLALAHTWGAGRLRGELATGGIFQAEKPGPSLAKKKKNVNRSPGACGVQVPDMLPPANLVSCESPAPRIQRCKSELLQSPA